MIRREDVQDLLSAVQQWCQEHVRAEDVDDAEEIAQAVGRWVGEVVVEQAVASVAEQKSYVGSSVPCGCGRRARFVSYRVRPLATRCGTVPVRRAYYHCRHCRTGQVPWDRQQGLNERHYTPGMKALVAEIAARLSYQETVELLARTTGLMLEESSAEYLVAEVGARVRQAEAAEMEGYVTGEQVAVLSEAPGRLYVSMDGNHAHIDGSWHEVKTGAVYEGVPGPQGEDQARQAYYVSAPEPAERFGERLYAAAAQAGVQQAQEVVVIGDGAEWIWNLAAHHYPGATEIVDYWHACEHLWALARVQYGEGSLRGARWAQDQCRRLKRDGPLPILRALRRLKPRSPEAAEALRLEQGYFTGNAHRMAYPQFRQRGLMIGSGPVEAGCKVVVGQRLKRAGMRWKHDGADHILALRCLVLNGQYGRLRQLARAA